MRIVAVGVVLVGALAWAGTPDPIAKLFAGLASEGGAVPAAVKPPRFAFTLDDTSVDSHDLGSLRFANNLPSETTAAKPTIATSADGKATWITTNLAVVKACAEIIDDSTGDAEHYRPDYCRKLDTNAWFRGAAVFERAGVQWQPVAWHVYGRRFGQAKATAPLAKLERAVDKGAEDAVTSFETTLGDPKAFAATVSDRGDVTLAGSEKAELVIGGANVRATLAKWGLAFKVHDALRAGVTASASVVWIAANLEASKAKQKPALYRALIVYERGAKSWQIVQLSFSSASSDP
jgi:hypothetical protein